MPRVDKNQYENLSQEIVNAYLDKKASLTEGVYKKADELGLSPTQIKQLAWQTNTKAHLTLFDKKAEDKDIEFELADADDVLARVYVAGVDTEKSASAQLEPLVDFYSDLSDGNELVEKTASGPYVEERLTDPEKRSKQIMLIRKVASELKMGMLSSAFDYEARVKEVRDLRRKQANHPDFNPQEHIQLEMDALTYFGKEAASVLKDTGFHEHQSTQQPKWGGQNVPDTDTDLFKKIAAAKESFDAAISASKGLNLLKQRVGHLLV